MMLSVCIPCHGSHFKYISELVDAYNDQTVRPDEIVISVSETSITEMPSNLHSIVPLKMVFSPKQQFAGENRNITAQLSTGDVLIYNDADDIPSLRRVEFVKHVFEDDSVYLLVHNFAWDHHPNSLSSKEHLNVFQNKRTFITQTSHTTVRNIATKPFSLSQKNYANGPVCIRRKLFQAIKWTDLAKQQDIEFVKAASEFCRKNNFSSIYVTDVIYYYRNKLSSWKS
ncbi:glycosyltransferase family 2 protein [candidate division CSSED10-310 bacterium]|uniref:Glycosyltransferase family 2 protein n=1 Tax=candidate division CSSED10-310 bacterium TaxID=2855610 RepID=A0ABV6Z5S2_UNCC1